MQVTVGYSENPNSKLAANEAAKVALAKAGRSDTCDMVLLFATSRHNQQALREEVAAITGNSHAIYGGGSVGIITNDAFGYAGDQVGVACLWMEESSFNVFVERELSTDEREKGAALGRQLKAHGAKETTPVMLFYDAVKEIPSEINMVMATWLLTGLEEGLGFFPDVNGAGLQGDFMGGFTSQYLGSEIASDTAFAMAFSEDVCIDSVIMHGCRPASPYYTVTKADGPIILEINGEPAIPFLDKLLGPSITPDQYPFFLILGINHGEPWGEYDEENYASRLCLGISPERQGIVMFEPDMVEGTRFQIMFRSMQTDYMQPKIDEVFSRLGDREPAFAVYINCAGRAAGYNGVDVEDAYVIQKAMGDKVPLLGLYTGVEIAEIGGRPRGLDWTGVLCIFSTRKGADAANAPVRKREAWKEKAYNHDETDISVDAVLNLAQQNAAKVLALDTQSISIRYELEHKRRGFKLLSELSGVLHRDTSNEEIFKDVATRINAALYMQKTVVLLPAARGFFMPTVVKGYSDNEERELIGRALSFGNELTSLREPVVVNGADTPTRFASLRKQLDLNYFVLSPVIVEGEVTAYLITGRMIESTPFLTRLGQSDLENVQAISGLLASVLVYERLDNATKMANTDALTGLLNRTSLTDRVEELLAKRTHNASFGLMVIDFDLFKNVNDTYGHTMGDIALKKLAEILSSSFRSTDLVARIGGDEFVVFFSFTGEITAMEHKITRLIEQWRATPITAENAPTFYSTLSIGIAVAPRDGTTYEELFKKADIALYTSKEKGRDGYCIYSQD